MQKANDRLNDSILLVDGEQISYEDFLKNEKDFLDKLEEIKREGSFITRPLTGVEILSSDGPVIGTLYIDDYKVIIPFDTFIENAEDYYHGDHVNRMKFIISNRLGSDVDFTIVTINEEDKIIVGNRLNAIKKKKEQFWFKKNSQGDYLIKEGSFVEGRIVTVLSKRIIVEVFGVEKEIRTNEVSHIRVNDLRRDYSPGDTILLKVTQLERDDENKDISVKFSAKDAKRNPILDKIDNFYVGGLYLGEVSMISGDQLYVEIDGGVEVLCKMPKHTHAPVVGGKVVISISNINREKYRLFGIVVNAFSL